MEIEIKTKEKEEAIDITERINELIKNKKGKAVLIYTRHTTSGILINEGYDSDVINDILESLDELIPRLPYKHSEGNSVSHIKSSLIGGSVTIPFIEGKLSLGKWQKIFFLEFDGPRERKVIVELF